MYNVLYDVKMKEGSHIDLRYIEILRLINEQIAYLIKNIRMGSKSVPNDHLLSRLVRSFNYKEIESLKPEELNDWFDLFKRPILGSLDIGDNDIYSKPQLPHIYKHVRGEIWVDIDNTNPINLDRKNWRNFEAVKILYQPYSSMNINELYEFDLGYNKDKYAIIGVDCKVLMLQYIEWRNNFKAMYGNEEDTRTVGQFIRTYVLTNAIKSHMDHVISNIWIDRASSVPSDLYVKGQKLITRDFTLEVNHGIDKILELQSQRSMSIEHMLSIVQLPSGTNILGLYKNPFVYITDQVLWIVYIQRIFLVEALFKFDDKVPPSRSPRLDYFKNQIIKSLIELKQENFIPKDCREWFYTTLQKDILSYLAVDKNLL